MVDKTIQEYCYNIALEFLTTGGVVDFEDERFQGKDPWQMEEVYLVQYAASQALGLLLRSNPEHWWPLLSKPLCDVLGNHRYAAVVKANVLIVLGKLSYYMPETNPNTFVIQNLLFELAKFDISLSDNFLTHS